MIPKIFWTKEVLVIVIPETEGVWSGRLDSGCNEGAAVGVVVGTVRVGSVGGMGAAATLELRKGLVLAETSFDQEPVAQPLPDLMRK